MKSRTVSAYDEQIRRDYEPMGKSVDEILIDPWEAIEFAEAVLSHCGISSSRPNVKEVLRRLVALRKRGKRKGGLSDAGGGSRPLTAPKPR